MKHSIQLAFLMVAALAASAHAQTQIQVTVQSTGNLGLAPVITSFSDGTYDIFTTGQAASSALEDLAETGSPAGFSPPEGGPLFGNNPSPPIFTPGGSNSMIYNVSPSNDQFNFAAMVLPSNDWFVGNSADIDISSLHSGGIGTSITMSFNNIYDAGTELEDFNEGPGNPILGGLTGLTFPAGDGGANSGVDQNGVISLVTNPDFSTFGNAPAGLDNSLVDFDNLVTVTLTTVPEPSSGVLLSSLLAGIGLLRRRRRS